MPRKDRPRHRPGVSAGVRPGAKPRPGGNKRRPGQRPDQQPEGDRPAPRRPGPRFEDERSRPRRPGPRSEDERSRPRRPGPRFEDEASRPRRPRPVGAGRGGAETRPDRAPRDAHAARPARSYNGDRDEDRDAVRPDEFRPEPAEGRERSGGPAEGIALGFHAVRTALTLHPRKVERLLLARGQHDHRTAQLVALAREHNVPYQQVPREALDRFAAGGIQHQGIAARIAGTELLAEDELLDRLPADALVLVLDGVQDPRNVGAILRTAAATGVHGVFLPGHRSAGVSPAAVRTAAGGTELVAIARAGNVSLLLKKLEERGFGVFALDARGGRPPWEARLDGGVALVAGGEEKGIRPGVLEHCAGRITIPVAAEIASLNVSVAVGMVLGEAQRQRAH